MDWIFIPISCRKFEDLDPERILNKQHKVSIKFKPNVTGFELNWRKIKLEIEDKAFYPIDVRSYTLEIRKDNRITLDTLSGGH